MASKSPGRVKNRKDEFFDDDEFDDIDEGRVEANSRGF